MARPILDAFPFPLETEEAQELISIMVELYPEQGHALAVAQANGISRGAVVFNQRSRDMWRELLEEAARQGTLRNLVQQTREKFRANQALTLLDRLLSEPIERARDASLLELRSRSPVAASVGTRSFENDSAGVDSRSSESDNEPPLRVELHATDRDEQMAVLAALRSLLDRNGYAPLDAQRVIVTTGELIANVAAHSSDLQKQCTVVCTFHELPKRVRVAVADRGHGFDLERTLAALTSHLVQGGREHGLLRAIRYTTSLRQIKHAAHTLIATRVARHQRSTPALEWLVAPVDLVLLDHEESTVEIGSDSYFLDEIALYLTMPDAFQEYIWEPLRRSTNRLVLYAVTGSHRTGVSDDTVRIAMHLIGYLRRIGKSVAIFAATELDVHSSLRELSKEASVPFFEKVPQCLKHLRSAVRRPWWRI